MALGVDGVRIGTWTAPGGVSGCTVVLPPAGTVGAIAVRGAAPGTREAAALGPAGKVTVCHAVVLSGGSAFGLASADGVVRWLEERGTGYEVFDGVVVPIVGAAIVLDEAVVARDARPGPDQGYAACAAAADVDPPEGGVGVGAGCTVAKVAGLDHAWRSGQGIAVRSAAGVTVGALVANNAVGEVVGDDGAWIARARIGDDAVRYPETGRPLRPDADPEGGPSGNTVIGCIVTDARLTKQEAHRVADLGHSGLARALRPAHTDADGDALFCLATGRVDATVDLVAHLAAEAVAAAVRRGPLRATGRRGLPGLADDRP
ncbi:MAG TPA: P1 family peptidase [Egicoccus sp.]|nr:P1 family peptidase [Egicoccus sp.]HSK22027.1 P1 family peptidase [Egicoccus sp.]